MTLTSDNGYQFISEQFKRFFTGKRHRSTHSSTGMQKGLWTDTLEEIREKITAVLEDPSEAINTSPFCFRSTSNRSAPGEKSPAELLLCRSLWTSSDLLKSPTSFLKQMEQSKQGNQYNGRHAAKIISYNPQNLVHGPRSYKNCTVGRVGNSIYAAENELLYNPTDWISTRHVSLVSKIYRTRRSTVWAEFQQYSSIHGWQKLTILEALYHCTAIQPKQYSKSMSSKTTVGAGKQVGCLSE